MPLSRTNDIEVLRRVDPVEREKVLTGILDKRMKQMVKLQSKHQVLHQCQKLLVQKVIQYMNQLDQSDVKYLKQSEMYTQRLQVKQNILMEKERTLEQVRSDLWLRVEEISQIKQLVKQKNGELQVLVSVNESLLITNQKEVEISSANKKALEQCRCQASSLKQKVGFLTQEGVYLNRQMNMYIQEIKVLSQKLKGEEAKQWNQSASQAQELQLIQRKMNRQLLQKDKLIENLQLTVSIIKETHSQGLDNKSVIKRAYTIHRMQGTTIGHQESLSTTRVLSGTQMSGDFQMDNRSEQTQEQLQVYKIEVPKQGHRTNFKLTVSDKPSRPVNSKPTKTTNGISIPNQDISKQGCYKNQEKPPPKDSSIQSLSHLYQLYQQLKITTTSRFDLCQYQKTELQTILQQRPPRQQDVLRITELQVENLRLLATNHNAVERAETAFEAMRLCKQELRLAIENTPMEIYPKRSASKTIHRSSFKALGNSSSLNTASCKRRYRKMGDPFNKHQEQTAVLGCLRDIYASGQLNLNKYVKMTSSSFSSVEINKARKSIR